MKLFFLVLCRLHTHSHMIAVGVLYFLLTRSRAHTRRLRDGNLAGGAQRAGRRQCTADAIGEDGGERSIHGSAPRSSHRPSVCKQAKPASKQQVRRAKKSSKMQHVLACRVLA
jgi:hypothetical protein